MGERLSLPLKLLLRGREGSEREGSVGSLYLPLCLRCQSSGDACLLDSRHRNGHTICVCAGHRPTDGELGQGCSSISGFPETRGVHSHRLVRGKHFSFLDSVDVLDNPCLATEIKTRLLAHEAASGRQQALVRVFKFGARESRMVREVGEGSGGRAASGMHPGAVPVRGVVGACLLSLFCFRRGWQFCQRRDSPNVDGTLSRICLASSSPLPQWGTHTLKTPRPEPPPVRQ